MLNQKIDRTMTPKGFVLVCESFDWDGASSDVIGVYDTRLFANEQMFAASQCWEEENTERANLWDRYEDDSYINYEDPTSGDYIRWDVYEHEVQRDPENH